MENTTNPPLRYQAVNPATGELVAAFDTATDAEIEGAVSAAYGAYRVWSSVPIAERTRIVERIAALFAERSPDLAALATEEMGKSAAEGRGEAQFSGQIFSYFANEAVAMTADQAIPARSGTGVLQRRPLGPLLGVMPWNYPFYQVARFTAPNLMLGNTIILKHAESVPRCALAIQQIMTDAGLPSGAYVNVFASHGQIERIIADERTQGVSLTGSERAGSAVGAIAGRHLKKCVLELGGSDPYVILDSDDIGAAALTAWSTRISNAGQACNSNKRIIVTEEIFDEFVSKLVECARDLRPGAPDVLDDGTFAPMASRAAAERLATQVDHAVAQGATLHVGGQLGPAPTAYYSPAVLTGVTGTMSTYREELFGPVAVVYSVANDEEAVTLANDTPYGLGGAVFSTDTDRARRVADRIEAGMISVNTPSGEGVDVPFGGVKRSGFGRELGPIGMDEFANRRVFFVAG